jgi:RHS repeat-associated protein
LAELLFERPPGLDDADSGCVAPCAGGNAVAELRYKPWGETRLAGGTTLSKYQFTGQYNESELGLYYYNARWYDGSLNHFTSPDTVIADNYQTLDYDRYAYARSNPVRYNDPSGHCPVCGAAIGATIGAIAGAASYTYYNHANFSVNEYQTAVIAGAIAGGLIGSGVGVLAAPTVTAAAANTAAMAIGAGSSAGVTGANYLASNENNFETTPFVIQTGTAAAAGGITSNMQNGFAIKAFANIGASEASYFTSGEKHSFGGVLATAGIATGATGLQFFMDTTAEDYFMINRSIQSNLTQIPIAEKLITAQNIRTVIFGTGSGISTGFAMSSGQWLQRKFEKLDK